jgi:hypothetical protein
VRGAEFVTESKSWTAKNVPLGVVKMEIDMGFIKTRIVMELTGFGSGGE